VLRRPVDDNQVYEFLRDNFPAAKGEAFVHRPLSANRHQPYLPRKARLQRQKQQEEEEQKRQEELKWQLRKWQLQKQQLQQKQQQQKQQQK